MCKKATILKERKQRIRNAVLMCVGAYLIGRYLGRGDK